ncbi:MAG: 2-dehydropantoate 2-reductase [Nitrospirae bacterium]|nr:2-dehydropantoate 2-reductase [Nitrospirota bacterium]
MRVLIYGAGAVGGYFGARLQEGGADATFVARGNQLAALRTHGIRLDSVNGAYKAPVRAVPRLADAPPADLVLLCVKGHDLRAATIDLAANLGPDAVVMPLMNGVGHLDTLREALGAGRVIAATVFIGARVAEPGVIRHSAAGFVRAGRDPDGVDPVVTRVVDFLDAHGMNITTSRTIRLDMWKKLLWNVGFNGPSALTGATVGAMTPLPGIAWLIRGLIAEAVRAGQAEGMALDDALVEKTCAQTQGLDDFKTSMLQDVEAGRPIENEPFYGYLLTLAGRHHIALPLTRMLHDALALRFPA